MTKKSSLSSPGIAVTEDFISQLGRQIDGEAHFDAFNRALYSTDASIYQIQPLGVVFPRSAADVAAVVTLAAQYGLPVLPRGGGTSQAGQTVGAAIVLDFSRHLDQILEINAEEKWARVQPGLVHATLASALTPFGLQFGPDPSSGNRACFGGLLGNNASGAHSLLYGMTVDHIQSVECVLADGSLVSFNELSGQDLIRKGQQSGLEGAIYNKVGSILNQYKTDIRSGYPKTWRRVSGYNLDRLIDSDRLNLASLITGSEGTLAVATSLKVGLVPRPKRTALLVVHFEHLLDSLRATPIILETNPSAVELMDGLLLNLTRSVPAYARQLSFVQGQPEALLMVEYYGENDAELVSKLDKLERHLKRNGINGATVRASEPEQIAQVWGVRKAGLGLLMSIKGDFKPIPFIEDAAVPVEHLAEYIGRLETLAGVHDTRVAYYAHASTGLLHVRPLINLKETLGVQRMEALAQGAFELVCEYGGTMSGEHGDGLARSVFNEQLFGPRLYQAFQEVKGAFDPQNMMNPGKIVHGPPMTENLRYGPDYQTIHLKNSFDFSKDFGFAGAIEMCNGAGVCRRLNGGTMCPSFQATRDETHSTRGRANLLRTAMSGALPLGSLTHSRMYDALDLCLECKACKSECPSAVDMAKIKAEWLTHYYEDHGTPLRAQVFGYIHQLNKLGSAFAPLSNWMTQARVTRWLMGKLLGIHPARQLPNFARTPFHHWFDRRQQSKVSGQPEVVLFHDTFMTYNEPDIGKAATELLEAAGYTVVLVKKRQCCGRPMISKGLLSQAKENAEHNVSLLADYARKGIPIIGCEPSCLLTIRDDYPDLVPGENSRLVAEQTYTFEEFISRNDHPKKLSFGKIDPGISIHGHCHQKSLVGMGPSKEAMGLLTNTNVKEIASGCCGMAGSFGYEREHYDLSLEIGELVLFPAVRAAGPGENIVAAGMSCRQQIMHATGKTARHPAEILRLALLEPYTEETSA